MSALVIREFGTENEVRRFDTTGMSERQIERLDAGLNRNLDHDKFYTVEEP